MTQSDKILEEAIAAQKKEAKIVMFLRKSLLYILAERYYNYLKAVAKLKEEDLLAWEGEKRGQNKWLSNEFGVLERKFMDGVEFSYTPKSLEYLKMEVAGGTDSGVWEHVVPKQKYIQGVAEKAAFSGNPLSIEELYQLLLERWWVVKITTEEDKKMCGKQVKEMGDGWNGEDWWYRYRTAGIVVPGWFEPNS